MALEAEGRELLTQAGIAEGIAVRWYRLAAEQAHDGAQLSLGWMYSEGLGVAARGTRYITKRLRLRPRPVGRGSSC